ncbi:o-succinylbenzoic acid (OSB) synthetase [Thiorhodococcus drewsii AZ1]|uniref:o-succinylbenzoate synthase n=1 Tax=Thiorhodococcus drewsii AZ1 TaxID=765913 RepID=G2DZU5_9GAMM|nr:o-succinylbenzoate synthase [Thiorhodococcus drewsii]EGV31984.1 o-succinylbenzoic acid (OSB) synthetase [Thiorhodococcus drewsii AZ1]
MIDRLQIQAYDLPLRQPWSSAKGGFDRRRGWLVRLESEGLVGFGDCAPLPAAGTETQETACSALECIGAAASGDSADRLLERFEVELSTAPATRFALDCALADLASQRAGMPLRQHLSPSSADRVAVNAMLGPLDRVMEKDLVDATEHGFQVIKLKVGLGPLDEEIARLSECARQLPSDMRLRLDANGAWTQPEAERLLDALIALPIESIEEPLHDPTPETLAALQTRAPFPLARDESIQGLGHDLDPAALGVRRIVIKPAALGGLTRTLALARRAEAAGIEVVITSLVESAAGLWPSVQLAAAIATPLPHGLATANWLAEDLGAPPRAKCGWIRLPTTPGSGFRPTVP